MDRAKPRKKRTKAILLLAAIIVVIIAVVAVVVSFSGRMSSGSVSAYALPCSYSDTVRVFGSNVLYYDGSRIHCMSDKGTVRWSFPIGNNAGYDCSDTMIAAWTGSTLYLLDANGNASYNDNLGEEIQFARIGKQYVGAVVGTSTSPRLLVKDHTGAHMDEEGDAYDNLVLLDLGFYGASGEYMWTLALDVFGTASNTILNTFEVGRMNTGEISLGEPITYSVLYDNGTLRAINTRKMLGFTSTGTEDTSASVLVYGWRLIHHELQDKGNAYLLFAPSSQTDSSFELRSLRLISGSKDKRYDLPATCMGAVIWNKTVYAFSEDTMFRAGMNDSRFATYELPMNERLTRVIGTLKNGRAVVACGEKVYVVSLPQMVLGK